MNEINEYIKDMKDYQGNIPTIGRFNLFSGANKNNELKFFSDFSNYFVLKFCKKNKSCIRIFAPRIPILEINLSFELISFFKKINEFNLIFIENIEYALDISNLSNLYDMLFYFLSQKIDSKIFALTYSLESIYSFANSAEKYKDIESKFFKIDQLNQKYSLIEYNITILINSLNMNLEVRF